MTTERQVLYVCMGSACHQRGGFRLVPPLQEILARHGLEERVELKGAFCLNRCGQGRTVMFEDCTVTGLTLENLEDVFAAEILPRVRRS